MISCVEEIPIPVQPASIPGQKDLLAWAPPEPTYLRQCNMCGDNPPVIYDAKVSPAGCPKCGFNEFSLVLSEEVSAQMVATKAPPKPTGKVKPESKPVLKPVEFEYIECDVPVNKIRPRPNQPRKYFDDEKIEELANNIEQIGLQQRVVLELRDDGYYQMIAGERRWRAFVRRDWDVIPARVVTATKEQKSLICLSENLLREDLSPIEEANSYQDTLTDTGWTQSKLAKELGISQGQISNRIRLLKTPAAIQALIISGEIDASAGRDVATWCDVPAVHEELQKWTVETKAGGGEIEKDDVLCATLRFAKQCSRPVSTIYAGNGTEKARILQFETLSPNVEKRLDIRMVPPFTGGEPVMRAFNLQLWDELAVEYVPEARIETEDEDPGDDTQPVDASSAPAAPSAELLEQKKQRSAEELEKSLRLYLARFFWRIIAEWIPDSDSGIRWRLLCYFGYSADDAYGDDRGTAEELASILDTCGGRVVANSSGGIDLWASSATARDPETFSCLLLSLWAKNKSYEFYNADDLQILSGLVKEFGIQIPDVWGCDRDFLLCFEVPELVNLVSFEWKRKGPGPTVTDRLDLISWVLEENARKKFPAPKCLTKLKLFA